MGTGGCNEPSEFSQDGGVVIVAGAESVMQDAVCYLRSRFALGLVGRVKDFSRNLLLS